MGWAVLSAVGVVFLLVLYVKLARQAWRGPSALDESPVPEAWPFGPAAWRGVVRCWVADVPLVIVAFAALGVEEAAGDGTPASQAALAVMAVAFGLALVIMLGVTLYNRPRSLVPRHLRDEPGVLGGGRRTPRPVPGRRG